MKKPFQDPELEVERFDGVIDCLTISEGDHEDQNGTNQQDLDT